MSNDLELNRAIVDGLMEIRSQVAAHEYERDYEDNSAPSIMQLESATASGCSSYASCDAYKPSFIEHP